MWPGQSSQLENLFRVALDNSNRIFDLLMLLIMTNGVLEVVRQQYQAITYIDQAHTDLSMPVG